MTKEPDVIWMPGFADDDPEGSIAMLMGRTGYSLRDPWFYTEAGQDWLSEHEDFSDLNLGGA